MADAERTPDGKGILHPEGMRAARDLAAGVVHEINNLLGVVIGNAHLVRKNASNPEAVEKYAGEIKGAADEGRELMRKLAALASNEPLQARVVSLNDLATDAVSGLTGKVELELSSKDPSVTLDPWLARESFVALARFMCATSAVSSVRVTTRIVGSAVSLTFEDDGGRVSAEDLSSLFVPFAKVARRPKPGIGLARVADLAARFDGHVTVSNRAPHGLRVVLTLPLVV